MPLLIYGADVPFDEKIGIKRFVTLVDDASWKELMPKGVTKKIFRDFIEYYDPDVFEAAGVEIRRLAKTAEKLAPGRRVQQIARIFSYFKNPDKETVLTPMAVSITRRTLAGYTSASVNAICWKGDLVETLKTNPAKFTTAITQRILWAKEDKTMQFDAVVGNPPYQQEVAKKISETNGQARSMSIFHLFQYVADQIATGYVTLIYPGIRWMHRSGKGMEEFGLKQINDPRLCRLDFYPDSTEVFSSVAIADGISIVCKDLQKSVPGFRYVYHGKGSQLSVTMKSPGKALIPLNPNDGAVMSKVRSFASTHKQGLLADKILSQKLFEIESDFVEKNPMRVRLYDRKNSLGKGEIKLLTNDRAGKAGRARWYVVNRSVVKALNQKYIDEWQVVVSSANAGGQKRDWQLEIIDNHSAFGRSRVALASFKTKSEAEHFYAYCKTYLIRFLFLMTDEALTSLAKAVPDFGDYTSSNKLLDFTKDLNGQLYSLIGLTKSEQNHVETTINEIDAKRSKR